MSIALTTEILATQTFIQGDARDPLGIWGGRLIVTGDGTVGGTKVTFQVPADRSAAYVYTCYSAFVGQLTPPIVIFQAKCRLLTNWPDVGPISGVTGYSTTRVVALAGDDDFTAPMTGPLDPLVSPNERFLLLYDPRPGRNSVLQLVELEYGGNLDTIQFAFEVSGYFWDRSVMEAPGGPRHPGS